MPGFHPRYKHWPSEIQRAWDIGDEFTLKNYFSAAAKKGAKTKAEQKATATKAKPLSEDEILLNKHMNHPDTKHIMSWHEEDILKQAATAIMTDLEKQQDREKVEKLHGYLSNPEKVWGKGGIFLGAPIGAAIGTAFINSSKDSIKMKAGKAGAGAFIGATALGTYGYIKGKLLQNKIENMQKTSAKLSPLSKEDEKEYRKTNSALGESMTAISTTGGAAGLGAAAGEVVHTKKFDVDHLKSIYSKVSDGMSGTAIPAAGESAINNLSKKGLKGLAIGAVAGAAYAIHKGIKSKKDWSAQKTKWTNEGKEAGRKEKFVKTAAENIFKKLK